MLRGVEDAEIFHEGLRNYGCIFRSLDGNNPALREALDENGFDQIRTLRRGKIEANHSGLVEFLPPDGEIFRDIDGGIRGAYVR